MFIYYVAIKNIKISVKERIHNRLYLDSPQKPRMPAKIPIVAPNPSLYPCLPGCT